MALLMPSQPSSKWIAIAGIGTGVGKTVASAILAIALGADYWKPVQCGDLHKTDADKVKALTNGIHCFAEAYRIPQPLSVHAAAALSSITIDVEKLHPPATTRPLLIECAGGILVPYTETTLQIDLFNRWNCEWILVSQHYLGSINHTLLTLEAMRHRHCRLLGIVFNGDPLPATESVIELHAGCPVIGHFNTGRLAHSPPCDLTLIRRYASQWKHY